MNKIIAFLLILLIAIPFVSAQLNLGDSTESHIQLGKKVSEFIYWDGHAYSNLISQWTNDIGYVTSASSDTNESLRFSNLTNTDCSGTDKVVGVYTNGTVVCSADITGGSTDYTNLAWTNQSNTFTPIQNFTDVNISNNLFVKGIEFLYNHTTSIVSMWNNYIPNWYNHTLSVWNEWGKYLRNQSMDAQVYGNNTYLSISTPINQTNNTLISINNATANKNWTASYNWSSRVFDELGNSKNRTSLSYKNLTDIPTCSGTDKLTYQSSILQCATDATGAGGGNKVNLTTTTCGGTDKVSAIDNATGIVTCTTDAGGGYPFTRYNYTSKDKTVTTTARADLLTLELTANKRIMIECNILNSANGTVLGIQYQSNITGSVAPTYQTIQVYTSATAQQICSTTVGQAINPNSLTCAPTSSGGSVIMPVRINAYANQSTAGIFALRVGSEIANAPVNVSAGSWCRSIEYSAEAAK